MHFNLLDKYDAIKPYLVEIYDTHELYRLGQEDKPRARSELVGAIGDLLEKELNGAEREIIADILVSLVEQAARDLRIALAQRLASMDKAPLKLILKLSHDEIDVAGVILRQSPLLSDMDLIYIIQSESAQYWQEIARRRALSNKVMGILADTRDIETALTLLDNHNITLSPHVLGIVADLAQEEQRIPLALQARSDMNHDMVQKILSFAAQDLKDEIAGLRDLSDDFALRVLDEVDSVLEEETSLPSNANPFPTYAMVEQAKDKKLRGELFVKDMLKSLRIGAFQRFVAEFAVYVGLEARSLIAILTQDSGQGLAILCKAHAIQKPDFMTIFLLTVRIRNQGALVDTTAITSAVNYYNVMSVEKAREILACDGGTMRLFSRT